MARRLRVQPITAGKAWQPEEEKMTGYMASTARKQYEINAGVGSADHGPVPAMFKEGLLTL